MRLSRQEVDALITLEKQVHDTASPEVLEPDTAQWMGFSSRPSMTRHHYKLHGEVQKAYLQPIQRRKVYVYSLLFYLLSIILFYTTCSFIDSQHSVKGLN